MIVNLQKFLIYGNKGEMDRFFVLAQRAGFIEFFGSSHKKALELPEGAKNIISAIKVARHHTAHTTAILPLYPPPEKLAEEIIELHANHEKLHEEQRVLKAEIARISIFGNFNRPELDSLERETKRVFQFFCMKSETAHEISQPPEVIYIGTEYDLDYFISINRDKTQYPKMIEIVIEKPVGVLRERLQRVVEELALSEKALHETAIALPYLQNGLLDFLNQHHLQLAKHDAQLPLGNSLFAIEGWVPETKVDALYGLISGLEVECEQIAIESNDAMPTCMENKGVAKLGEDLVHVYDTPSATDQDPSLWVIFFFAFFFSIIISDAGYGLIYLSIGLFLRWKMPKATGGVKRLIRLVITLGTCCIIWGIATASFFGIEIGPNNPFRKTSFLHYIATKKAEYHLERKDDVYEEWVKEFPAIATAKDGHQFLVDGTLVEDGRTKYPLLEEFYDNILLEFSLFIGMIHISISFLRYIRRNSGGIGWIIFMVGGYLFFPSILNATSMINFMGWVPKTIAYPVGEKMVYGGLALVFVIALLQKKKWGALHELTNAIQVFADVLSYLRLYALALAGMIMATTFNDMGMRVGLLTGGIIIIIIGHVVNMSLSIMAGVIHGLRLNFLEWYHYSFEGGGRLFNPLRLRKVK